ncbi:methyltransferase domain-containing protein [bacterium]|nr:methyltransferase domain-containing protein [bacterium]
MKFVHWSTGWYYNIELEEGRFTDGTARRNLALTRKLLRNVDVKGKTCIDIGTTEAVIPVLLKRAGAKTVVAHDRLDISEKVNIVKEVYQADFEYIHGISLPDLQTVLSTRQDVKYFDLVVFSGVLYHLFNPLGILAVVRSFCKVGGLFLLETRTLHDPEAKLILNESGRYGRETHLATTAWLDYALRMVGLEPLYAVYSGRLSMDRACRMAILCRSHGSSIPLDKTDDFMQTRMYGLFEKTSNESMRYDLSDLVETKSDIDVLPFDDQSVAVVDGQSLYGQVSKVPMYVPSEDEVHLTLKATM